MADIVYFNALPTMKEECCIFCHKDGCDVLIQENVPGGNYGVAHSICLDNFFAKEGTETYERHKPFYHLYPFLPPLLY